MARGAYKVLAERLSRRIKAGDYHLQPLPAERELAVEVGVSHMTARKAILHLMDEGLLYRQDNGRVAVRRGDPNSGSAQVQVALLAPAWESDSVTPWSVGLTRLTDQARIGFRTVYYTHWDDPHIFSAFEGFDGVFFIPTSEERPSFFLERLLSERRKVVVLDDDWTEYGVPSLRTHPPTCVHQLLDHLASLGHSAIDCLNVQPVDSVIAARIRQWRLWLAARGRQGQLIDRPVKPYTNTISAAYDLVAGLLEDEAFNSKALLCTTEAAAFGATRALIDGGVRPGHDIAVCTIDSDIRAEYSVPSLTCLKTPDARPYLSVCLDWMAAGKDAPWNGPLLVQPERLELVVRESTVPDIGKKSSPLRAQRARAAQRPQD